jgi:hypothetical protein
MVDARRDFAVAISGAQKPGVIEAQHIHIQTP